MKKPGNIIIIIYCCMFLVIWSISFFFAINNIFLMLYALIGIFLTLFSNDSKIKNIGKANYCKQYLLSALVCVFLLVLLSCLAGITGNAYAYPRNRWDILYTMMLPAIIVELISRIQYTS